MQIFQGQIRFGIHSGQQNTHFADYAELWRRAEDLGFDWASVFDHFLPMQSDPEGPCFEGMTLLAALAASTTRIRCGMLVVGNTYRSPALLANMATTIDHVSGGRPELGIGAAWYAMEHDQYGIPFYTPGRRIRMLVESAKILKSLWTQHRTTFHGRYYTITDALCEPKPLQQPSIPLWIGGSGERLTLRVVAESADGWNTFLPPLEAYQRKLGALAGHCREVGRSPEEIRLSLAFQAVVGETEAEVREQVQRFATLHGTNESTLRQRGVVGTPEQCVEQLLPYVKLGVADFLWSTWPPGDLRTLELIAREVAPVVKEEGSRLLAAR